MNSAGKASCSFAGMWSISSSLPRIERNSSLILVSLDVAPRLTLAFWATASQVFRRLSSCPGASDAAGGAPLRTPGKAAALRHLRRQARRAWLPAAQGWPRDRDRRTCWRHQPGRRACDAAAAASRGRHPARRRLGSPSALRRCDRWACRPGRRAARRCGPWCRRSELRRRTSSGHLAGDTAREASDCKA